MNSSSRLFLVDVFTQDAFLGNPVAVVIPEAALTTDQMLQIARWTGMPETVFVMQRVTDRRADYSVRIWSPLCELPFAGHPSIGTAHVLLTQGIICAKGNRFVQESPAGLVDMQLTQTGDLCRISFKTPIPTVVALDHSVGAPVLAALGYTGEVPPVFLVEAGARWLVVELRVARDVDALTPNFDTVKTLSDIHRVSGLTVFGPTDSGDTQYEVRSFAPAIGVPEDAVCGGGNACAAALSAYRRNWRVGSVTHVIGQGKQVQRSGRVFWEGPDADKRVEIGGFAVTVSEGGFQLPK
jgi:PhzF family phenazine biosynthesis protein